MSIGVDSIFEKQCCKGCNTTLWGGALDDQKPYIQRTVNTTSYVQTNMGKLVADAMIHYIRTQKPEVFQMSGTDYIVAGINGGAIHGSIPVGKPITYQDIYNVLPIQTDSENGSGFTVFHISANKLNNVLKHSVSKINIENGLFKTNSGCFLNSSGIRYTVKPAGNTNESLEIDAEAILTCGKTEEAESVNIDLNSEDKVLICVPSYLAEGGEEYSFDLEDLMMKETKALYEIVGDYIEYLSLSNSARILFYTAAPDDINYENFNFPIPSEMSVLLKDHNGNLSKNSLTVYSFCNEKGYKTGVTHTDYNGLIKVVPPKGAYTLCIGVARSTEPKNNTFMYGEAFVHSYFAMDHNIECQVYPIDVTNYFLFDANYGWSQIEHRRLPNTSGHYSNFFSYTTSDNQSRYFTIVNKKNYSWSVSNTMPCLVPEISYLDNNGNPASFQEFPWEEGIKYVPWRSVPYQAMHVTPTSYTRTSYKGIDGSESGEFYDGTLFGLNHHNKVIGVRICHGKVINGLGFIYKDNNEFFIGTRNAEYENVIYFEDGEYITNLMISSEIQDYNCIASLMIFTNRPYIAYGPYGTSYSQPYVQIVENNQKKVIALLGEESFSEELGTNVVQKIAVCAI